MPGLASELGSEEAILRSFAPWLKLDVLMFIFFVKERARQDLVSSAEEDANNTALGHRPVFIRLTVLAETALHAALRSSKLKDSISMFFIAPSSSC